MRNCTTSLVKGKISRMNLADVEIGQRSQNVAGIILGIPIRIKNISHNAFCTFFNLR